MRLMLGKNGYPELLVEVSGTYFKNEFDFWALNGAWYGRFKDGVVTIKDYPEYISNAEILTDNQDRLRGDYNDVFVNFDDVNYIAPKIEYTKNDDDYYDDDFNDVAF